MPHLLRDLVITEVSSVDRGAGEGVKVMLMKRAGKLDDAGKERLATGIDALRKSVASINADPAITDKTAAVRKAVEQFEHHIAGTEPEHTEKSMTPDEIKKAIADGVAAATTPLTAEIAKLKLDLAVERLPAEHREFCKAMSDEDKKRFAEKTKEERDAECAKAAQAAAGDPQLAKALSENDEMRKRLAVLEDKDTAAQFEKRAEGLGLKKEHGAIMRKAYSGDAEAQKQLDALLKGLAEQVRTGKVFEEFGSSQGGAAAKSAYDELVGKAQELRKTETELTKEQAFDRVYNDPANADLAKRHRDEEARKRAAVAAAA